ncbi:class I SAM-dependent methyltransferase [Imperialibacter roseus]|uniref:Class I SAM-dependent methyltransferase n=1 Tax=Imperialibacter roseus TaxID=1324217 RepID=A0ABZ0IZ41_9BACT|nr:class I SAM-dependent methyltransferase [Imperialibacter roseus]WOK09220.1 class I SAM-dependent methyltransferase [Imperialibacter roseus]
MELSTAIKLIENGVSNAGDAQSWLDLGAGNGLFTRALAAVLPSGSVVTAIDKSSSFSPTKNDLQGATRIDTRVADFTTLRSEDLKVNGILMANSLHYVKDQEGFLKKVLDSLLPDGRLIVVEYDTDRGNMWVPYPLSFSSLTSLLTETSAEVVTRLGSTPSQFQRGGIYSALIMSAA